MGDTGCANHRRNEQDKREDDDDACQQCHADHGVTKDQAGQRHAITGHSAAALADLFFGQVTGDDGNDRTDEGYDRPADDTGDETDDGK